MVEYLLAAIGGILAVYFRAEHILERGEWRRERDQWNRERGHLLNRLMAPSAGEYAGLERTLETLRPRLQTDLEPEETVAPPSLTPPEEDWTSIEAAANAGRVRFL
jgi:hypothetical protein